MKTGVQSLWGYVKSVYNEEEECSGSQKPKSRLRPRRLVFLQVCSWERKTP